MFQQRPIFLFKHLLKIAISVYNVRYFKFRFYFANAKYEHNQTLLISKPYLRLFTPPHLLTLTHVLHVKYAEVFLNVSVSAYPSARL